MWAAILGWELNLGPLGEEPVFLTVEQSLQPQVILIYLYIVIEMIFVILFIFIFRKYVNLTIREFEFLFVYQWQKYYNELTENYIHSYNGKITDIHKTYT